MKRRQRARLIFPPLVALALVVASGGCLVAFAQTGTIVSGSVPPTGGFGLFVFGGGTNAQLVAASGCPPSTAAFWATNPSGDFVAYVPASTVAVVNAAWNAMFPSGIPANTPLIGKCMDQPASDGVGFTLFSLDKFSTGPAQQVTQTGARVGRHEGYDRLVFEFSGNALPGYRIEYVTPPASQCASGLPVPLMGQALVKVTLRNTVIFNSMTGTPTVSPTHLVPQFPEIREVQEICGFEALAVWAVGVQQQKPFRVFELQNPARLVIDIQQ